MGFRSASNQETDTDGQQAGEVAYHGESLLGGTGPGWNQLQTLGSSAGRSGRRVGVRVDVNGFGGGKKSKRFSDGQAQSGNIDRNTGTGLPVDEVNENTTPSSDTLNTLDDISPPKGHVSYKPGYGKPK